MAGTPGERGRIGPPLGPFRSHSAGQVSEPGASPRSVLALSVLGGRQWPWCPVLWPPRRCPGAWAHVPPGLASGVCGEPWGRAGSLPGTEVQ